MALYNLHVHLISGKDLIAVDKNGKSDPYVIFKMASGKAGAKSKVISKTLNPTWDQHFTIAIKGLKDTLTFELFDKDTFSKDDPMGKGEVSLDGLEEDKEHPVTVKLTDVDSGEVSLSLRIKRQKELDEDDD